MKSAMCVADNVALRDQVVTPTTGWSTDRTADATISFIERESASGSPFLAYVPFLAPHGGTINSEILETWHAAEEYVTPYTDLGYSKELAAVWGMVSQLDAAVGRILSALDTAGVADNTGVIFMVRHLHFGNFQSSNFKSS
jgi:arylsulfatase A-like enzyme